MFQMTDLTALGANAVSGNLLNGKAHEFLKEDSQIIIGLQSSVADSRGTVIVGDEVLLDDQLLPLQARIPIAPDDFTIRTVGLAGSQIVIRARSVTAASIYSSVIVDPI